MLGLDGELGTIAPGMIADIIIVVGDPSEDIRVLQDKRNIEIVIQGGTVVEFDDVALERRWPHQRAMTMSTGDLTYDLVYGSREPDALSVEKPPFEHFGSDYADVLRDIERREVAARSE